MARARLRSDRSPDGAADRRRRGRDDRLDRARARRRRGMVGHTRDRLFSRPRRRLPLGSYRAAAGEGTARLAGLERRGGDRRLTAVVVAQPPPALQLLQQPSPARTAGPGRRLLVAPRHLRPLCRAASSRSPRPHDRRVDRPDDDHAPPRQHRDRGSRRLARVRGGARTWVVAVVVCRGVPVSLCGSAVLVVLAGRPLRRLPGAGGRAGAGLVRLPDRSVADPVAAVRARDHGRARARGRDGTDATSGAGRPAVPPRTSSARHRTDVLALVAHEPEQPADSARGVADPMARPRRLHGVLARVRRGVPGSGEDHREPGRPHLHPLPALLRRGRRQSRAGVDLREHGWQACGRRRGGNRRHRSGLQLPGSDVPERARDRPVVRSPPHPVQDP